MAADSFYFLLLFLLVYAASFIYIIKTDIIYGSIYLFLFIYSIFALIGYSEFPQLSILLSAYFGEEFLNLYIAFIGLSFLSFFICFKLMYRKFFARPSYGIVRAESNYGFAFISFFALHTIFLYSYFLGYGQDLSYENVSNEIYKSDKGIVFQLFMHAFKLCPSLLLLLYFLCVNFDLLGSRVSAFNLKTILFLELFIFVVIALQVGNRTDILALTISVIFMEYIHAVFSVSYREQLVKRIKYFVLFGLLMLALMQYIESTRNVGGGFALEGWEKLLMKDYFAPAHILFAAIALNYIDPWTVLKSNVSNALFMLDQPYLQFHVMELFIPGVAQRSASYAFYLFAEGFIAMGWFGVLYNGIIPFLGISIWRFMGNSNSNIYNVMVLSLISTQFATVCRGQSSYFIKDIYIFFIPTLILLYFATGLHPIRQRKLS